MYPAFVILFNVCCDAPFIFLFVAQQSASQPVLSLSKDLTLQRSVRYSATFLELTSTATRTARHKKNKLPTLSVSTRSLKKFTVMIIISITAQALAVVL